MADGVDDSTGRGREAEAPAAEAAAGAEPRAAAPGAADSGATDEGGPVVPSAPEAARAAAEERALSDLLFNAETSALYHKAREGFLDAAHRLVMAGVLLSSSGAVVAIAKDFGVAPYLAAVPAALGALDIVFAFGIRAREHALLARRFLELARDAAIDGKTVRELMGIYYVLCGEESATYHAVAMLCHNQSCDARDSPDYKVHVTWTQRHLRHLVRFESSDFPPVKPRTSEEKHEV